MYSITETRHRIPRERRLVQVGHSEWVEMDVPAYDLVDVSGPRAFGYAYELRLHGKVVAESITEWDDKEINKVGQRGAVRVGFASLPWGD
jgi:hypothetical protein